METCNGSFGRYIPLRRPERPHRSEGTTLKKPSLSTVIITVFWVAYGCVTAYVFYRAIEPVERDLMNILGGFALVLIVGIAMLVVPKRRNRWFGDDKT